jgi:hypothetical protein
MGEEVVYYVLSCYHCGNKTQMKRLSHYNLKGTDNLWASGHQISIDYYIDWDLYLCPVCENETLVKTMRNSENIDLHEMKLIPDEMILYPAVSIDAGCIPNGVKKSFEAALRIKNLDGNLCAIGIRKTLEMMCKDRQAEGRDLYHKLKDLADKGVLPPIINEMATILRELGNEAAHGEGQVFSDELIQSMIKFTQAILDYIYNLPERLSDIQRQLGKAILASSSMGAEGRLKASMVVEKTEGT